jgi:hypothetical protein
LKKLLSKLINEDLTDYVKDRFIGFNLRQIQAIIDYSDNLFNIRYTDYYLYLPDKNIKCLALQPKPTWTTNV